MSSEAVPGRIPTSLVHGSQAPKSPAASVPGGKSLPDGGNDAAVLADRATAAAKAALDAQIAQLNKYLNDSGRANQFRLDPASAGRTIQEVNPASGAVIGEYSATEFPALARSLGVSGILVDSLA